jgi:hypothetical protein
MANLMMVVAVVADKALADQIYHVNQDNASLTPILSGRRLSKWLPNFPRLALNQFDTPDILVNLPKHSISRTIEYFVAKRIQLSNGSQANSAAVRTSYRHDIDSIFRKVI